MHKFILLLVAVVHLESYKLLQQATQLSRACCCPLSNLIFKKDKLFVNFLNYQKCQTKCKAKEVSFDWFHPQDVVHKHKSNVRSTFLVFTNVNCSVQGPQRQATKVNRCF